MSNNADLINSLCYDYESRYIYFEMADKHNPATWIINVFSDKDDTLLGQVRYYAQWRRYGFFPSDANVIERKSNDHFALIFRTYGASFSLAFFL